METRENSLSIPLRPNSEDLIEENDGENFRATTALSTSSNSTLSLTSSPSLTTLGGDNDEEIQEGDTAVANLTGEVTRRTHDDVVPNLSRPHRKTKFFLKSVSCVLRDVCNFRCFCWKRERIPGVDDTLDIDKGMVDGKRSILCKSVFLSSAVLTTGIHLYLLQDYLDDLQSTPAYAVCASNNLIYFAQIYVLWEIIGNKRLHLTIDFIMASACAIFSLAYHICDSIDDASDYDYKMCIKDICHQCGSIDESCEDLILPSGGKWFDSTGQYDCGSFGVLNYCPTYGAIVQPNGHSANEICCSCGGGSIPVGRDCCHQEKDENAYEILQHTDFALSFMVMFIPFLLIIQIRPYFLKIIIYGALIYVNWWNTNSDRRFDDGESLQYFGAAIGLASILAVFRILMYADKLYTISRESCVTFPKYVLKVLSCFDVWAVLGTFATFIAGFYIKLNVEEDYDDIDDNVGRVSHYRYWHGIGWHGNVFLGSFFVARLTVRFHDEVRRVQLIMEKTHGEMDSKVHQRMQRQHPSSRNNVSKHHDML